MAKSVGLNHRGKTHNSHFGLTPIAVIHKMKIFLEKWYWSRAKVQQTRLCCYRR